MISSYSSSVCWDVKMPQPGPPRQRPYRLQARQQSMEATRQRITEATVSLHQQVGPAATTVSAIADTAGVTRATVYRHFPSKEDLVAACSAHWRSRHPAPDIAAWKAIRDTRERLYVALVETYTWFEAAAPMLSMVMRDLNQMPPFVAKAIGADLQSRVETVSRGLGATSSSSRRRMRAVVTHALSVTTWQSLCEGGRLSNSDAAAAMAAAILETVPSGAVQPT